MFRQCNVRFCWPFRRCDRTLNSSKPELRNFSRHSVETLEKAAVEKCRAGFGLIPFDVG